MAMLMTPERSHRTPDSAPNAIGTDRRSELCIMPRRFSERSRAAHVRKANTSRNTTTPSTRLTRRPNPRVSWMPPRNAQMPAMTNAPAREGTTRSGTWKAVALRTSLSWNLECRPDWEPRPKTNATRTATSTKNSPRTLARRIDTGRTAMGPASELILPTLS